MADSPRIDELELKLAFLEDAHAKLDDVVRAQQEHIRDLEDLVKKLVEEYRELRDRLEDAADEAPPPHY